MATVRVLTGLIVQRQTVHLPVGLLVDDPECRESPEDCCQSGSGGGPGCCIPPPPATLWAVLYQVSDGCSCVPDCLELTYDADLDAWYSRNLSPDCGGDFPYYLRLKCLDGLYRLDVVDDSDVVGVAGHDDGVTQSCDPFLVANAFNDTEDAVCGGTFSYFVGENDCTPGSGSGSGGGGGVVTTCCGDVAVPALLHCTFGGSLASLGTVTLTHAFGAQWQGVATACGGDGIVVFDCLGGSFELSMPSTKFTSIVAVDACSPFHWSGSSATEGPCSGTALATVTG